MEKIQLGRGGKITYSLGNQGLNRRQGKINLGNSGR